MNKLKAFFRSPYVKGGIGMTVAFVICLSLKVAVEWAYDRYQEFQIIKAGHIAVIQPVLEQRARQARQQQAAKPTPTPQPEGTKK